jgi:hypothetical protein
MSSEGILYACDAISPIVPAIIHLINIIHNKMKINSSRFPIVTLPADIQSTLFLIQQELKCQKLFNHLSEVGMGDSYFQPHLDKLILSQLGMDDGKDETVNFYINLIDKRSRKIKDSNESLMKQAMKVYVALVAERDRRKLG